MPSQLASVLGKYLRCLVNANSTEACSFGGFHCSLQPHPCRNSYVFGRRNGLGKLRHFKIQMAMIPGGEHFMLNHILEPFEIDNEARLRVRLASNCDLKRVIVPVPVTVGAAAKDLFVLLSGPRLIPVIMRG